jgi:hypothetical protein
LSVTSLSESGKWWIPGKDTKKFYGELEFNQEGGGTLVLSDIFDNLYDFPRNATDFILLGELNRKRNDGIEITKASLLVDYVSKYQESSDANQYYVKIVVRLKYIVLGINIEDKDLQFDKIVLAFSNVDSWISAEEDLERIGTAESIDYENKRKKIWKVFSSPEINVRDQGKIIIVAEPKSYRDNRRLVRAKNIKFIIESLGDKSLENYLFLEGMVRDLLNFIITKEVVLQSFEGMCKVENESVPVQLLFRSGARDKMNKVKVKSPLLFYYANVKTRIDKILNKWFQVYSKAGVIHDLYFGVMYNTQSYVSNNFLMLFTALEVYHRAFLEETSAKKQLNISFRTNIIKKIDSSDLADNDKENVKELLAKKQLLSSQDRIEEVYDKFAEFIPLLSKKIEDKNSFIRKIVKYRNNLTHGGKPFSKFDVIDLFWQYKNLQLILQLCILSEIEFCIGEIKEMYLLDELAKIR